MRTVVAAALLFVVLPLSAAETIWIEAEHLRGVRGSCFPDLQGTQTAGHWALSGPGVAPEWTLGGESEWLSIACGPDDDQAAATYDCEVPEVGEWRVWVRYRDWRRQPERFALRIEQTNQTPITLGYGEQAVVDEEDELKLLWKWAFAWDQRTVKLVKGPAKITLLAQVKQPGHRQVDCLCLTTDASYSPLHREKPAAHVWKVLDDLRREPRVATKPLAKAQVGNPAAKVATFRDRGFVYLWNVGKPWQDELASKAEKKILFPFHTDLPLIEEFRKTYGNRQDVPIFSDPRIVPAFHAGGPNILDNEDFVRWLEANPDRPWANMMNYTSAVPLTERAQANWAKFRDRYVGNIAGESIGYFDIDYARQNERIKAAKSRTELYDILTEFAMAGAEARQKAIFGQPGREHYRQTIPCPSVGLLSHVHMCREWGAQTVGYENTSVAPSLAMRMAFLRGSARQYGGMMADYRSCNFGDAATIYANQGYHYAGSPRYVYDNSYDVWAGAGMTWYKFDIWHQYLSGCAMFYHEQGHDEFWQPGGNSTQVKPLQLSPKGRLIEQFLDVTKQGKHPERGTPFTPIAFLLDRAHGWDPTNYHPTYFHIDPALNPDLLRYDRHARMLKEWFKVAFHPYGPREAEINSSVNQIVIPGVFGDVFDVLVTSPTKLDALDNYPVVVLCGEVQLTEAWGRKLAAHMERGGAVLVCDDHVSGPGAALLKLPELGPIAEDTSLRWRPDEATDRQVTSQRYRYRKITGGTPLATASNGDPIAAVFERGPGRLVVASIPRGLGLDDAATPLTGLLLAHARQGLVPIEVSGEVEWLLNRTPKGWVIGLFNSAGITKPQHGVLPTDYAQRRTVRIQSREPWTKAIEWFSDAALPVARTDETSAIELIVPAGGVRILEVVRP